MPGGGRGVEVVRHDSGHCKWRVAISYRSPSGAPIPLPDGATSSTRWPAGIWATARMGCGTRRAGTPLVSHSRGQRGVGGTAR